MNKWYRHRGLMAFGVLCILVLVVGGIMGGVSYSGYLPKDDPAYCYDLPAVAQASDPTAYRNVCVVGQIDIPAQVSLEYVTYDDNGNVRNIAFRNEYLMSDFMLQDMRSDVLADYSCIVYRITNYDKDVVDTIDADVRYEQVDGVFRIVFERKDLEIASNHLEEIENMIQIQYLIRLTNQ